MKKIFILITAIFVMNVVNGQQIGNPILNHCNDKAINPSQKASQNKGQLKILNNLVIQNQKSLTWKWDTIVCFDTTNTNFERYTRTYDISSNVLSQILEQWQSGAWVYNIGTIYTYSITGKILTEINEEWQSGVWVNTGRITYTYDGNENVLTELNEG